MAMQRINAASLVPEAQETPWGDMAAHGLEDLVEIGERYKTPHDLTVEICHEGHFRDDREP